VDLETLSREEALSLMSRIPVGRVVYTVGGLPAVTPVNFALVGDSVIVRTTPGSRLASAVRDSVVAFEVDDIDAASHTGWSVTAIGQATEVRDPAELQRLAGAVQPWVDGARDYVIRIGTDIVTGRRLVPHADGETRVMFSD
jgi:uncharacterized protein